MQGRIKVDINKRNEKKKLEKKYVKKNKGIGRMISNEVRNE